MKDLSECTILIVDDTETNIDILAALLGDDYDISVAMDGQSALENISDDPPDLILLDIVMPGMDGYQVLEELKIDPKLREIPVIVISAMISGEIKNFLRKQMPKDCLILLTWY